MRVIDTEGVDLPDSDAAIKRAIHDARHMACAEVLEGHLNLSHRIEVLDAKRNPIDTVLFKETVRIED